MQEMADVKLAYVNYLLQPLLVSRSFPLLCKLHPHPHTPLHLRVKGPLAENPLTKKHKCLEGNELMIHWEIQGRKRLSGVAWESYYTRVE